MHPWSPSRVAQLAGLIVFAFSFSPSSPAVEPARLSGHVPAAATISPALRRLPADQRLKLAIGLPLHNRQALMDLLQEIYDPSSTNYLKYLSAEQFAARFGPSPQDYQSLIDFARTNGFLITGLHPNRTLLDVSASVADIEKVWHVALHEYQHPREPRTFYAPDTEPVSPLGIRILHVGGLDNFLVPRPAGLRPAPVGSGASPVPLAGAGPAGAYRGSDFRGAYARSVSLNGAGQMVGLLEFDGFYPSDIASYVSQSSVPAIPIITVTMDGYDGTPGNNDIEVALDIEVVSSVAPGLSAIVMYEAGPGGLPDDVLNRMATDNLAHQLSASWTFPISASTEQIFLQFAAQGQSYFNASGDNGAYSGIVNTPADDPNVTVVGGTILTTTGPGGAWVSETVWNRGGAGSSAGATGGGISTAYAIPSWQKPVNMTLNHGSSTMRNLPDVAGVADNVWVTYGQGKSETVGGTSCSAPLWAGFTAMANQQAAGFGRPPVGFLNPTIYRLGLSAGYNTNFHDVTVGNNTNGSSPTEFYAAAGYDLCTGWGSPFGQNLINALAPRSPSPLLTNVSATIVAEGCSPGNGAIDPWETVSVSFSVKNLGAAKTTNLVATLVADDGVLWPSAPQSYGVLNGGGATASRVFTFTAQGTCGGLLATRLTFQDGEADLGTLTFNFPLGKPLTVLTQNFDGIATPALPVGWTTIASNGVAVWITSTAAHDTGTNAAFADEPPSAGVEELISPPISLITSNAQLSFRNSFNTEADPAVPAEAFDGGMLEIQVGTNDFTDILAAGGSFASGGYTRTITTGTNSDNPLRGRMVWGGNSGGFISTVVNLPASAAGQTVVLKWRFAIDTGNFYGGFGWYLDSIAVRDGGTCCNPLADLAVFESVSPEPVAPGQALTYSVLVTNQGPGSAFGVLVSNELPASVQFATGSPGCVFTNGMVICDAGTVAGLAFTNFSYEILPVTGDSVTNSSSVGAYTPDPNASDNIFVLVSTVTTNAPPVVYLAPTNAVASSGASAVLQASAFGTTPLSYQWFFNGSTIAGETTPSLLLTNLQPEQSGAYSVVVANLNGATTSSVAQVTVILLPTLAVTASGFGSNWSVTLPSVAGLSYRLEYKESLTDSNWTPILPPVSGNGSPLSLVDTNAFAVPARFYRVSAQ